MELLRNVIINKLDWPTYMMLQLVVLGAGPAAHNNLSLLLTMLIHILRTGLNNVLMHILQNPIALAGGNKGLQVTIHGMVTQPLQHKARLREEINAQCHPVKGSNRPSGGHAR